MQNRLNEMSVYKIDCFNIISIEGMQLKRLPNERSWNICLMNATETFDELLFPLHSVPLESGFVFVEPKDKFSLDSIH